MYGSVAIGAAVLASCPVFPADNHWNLRVDQLPVHPRSDAIVRSIGADDNMHADFGSGRYEGAPIGIPYVAVRGGQRRVPVSFRYPAAAGTTTTCTRSTAFLSAPSRSWTAPVCRVPRRVHLHACGD